MKKILTVKNMFLFGLPVMVFALLIVGCAGVPPGESREPMQNTWPTDPANQSDALSDATSTLVAEPTDTMSSTGTLSPTNTLPSEDASLPTETPQEEGGETPEEEMMSVMPHLSFSYDDLLAMSTISESVPAHIQFIFESYVLTDTVHRPQISVYVVNEYEAMSAAAAEQIDALRQLLLNRPEVVTGTLPFLPLTSSTTQVMKAQIAYLDFQNGTGVRYLTQYDSDITPINNNELFYTFQGLTNDGRYYVSATFPVSYPDLPANPTQVPEGFDEDQESYLASVMQQFDEAEASTFSPDLSQLDAVITSIAINNDSVSVTNTEVSYPTAVLSAVQVLSENLNIPPEEIKVASYEKTEWPDGCLGLGESDELCTQVIVSGWTITMHTKEQTYEVHTDETGSNVRWQLAPEPYYP